MPSTHPLGGTDLGLDPARNGGRDLVLQVEKLLEIAIVALGPQLPAGFRLDQLRRDAHAIRGLPHAAVHQVIRPERQARRTRIATGTLEGKTGVAGNDRQRTVLGQRGDDVLGDAVREIVLLGIAAEIVERQDRDGWPAAPLDRSGRRSLNG